MKKNKIKKFSIKRFWLENRFAIISIIIIGIIFNIKLPYYISTPGGIIDISDRIEYENKKKINGSLNLLFVSQYIATPPTYLLSYIIPDWDLEDISTNQISNETTEEIDIRNKIMLDNSINNAIYVAYQEAGAKIEIKNKRNVVIGTTLDNGLKIGDELLEIDSQTIDNINTVKNIIQEKEIGDILKFKLIRDNKEKEIEAKVKDMDGQKGIGVIIITDYDYEIDPEIELKFKKSESGSSGGMMMALSIYSAISGDDILKGRNIAGTGTIDMAGNVGEIDGIKYKIMGAVKNDMDIVLVPSGNYKEAKKVVKEKGYDIKLVEIKTFKDAIKYFKK